MATRPPLPPPRGPQLTPPDPGPSSLRTMLKVAAYIVGGIVLLMVVGVGLLFAICSGGR